MRFHIGFSKRISWKWLIGAIGIIAAFFFGNHVALAAEAGTYNYSPSSVSVYNNNGSTTHNLTWSSTNSNALGGNGAYARFSSATCGGGLACPPIYSGEVTYSYAAHKFCSSSDKVTLTTRFYVRNNNNDNPPNLGFNITGTQASINSKTYDSSNMVYVVNFTIADNSSFQLNYNFNDPDSDYYFYSSSTRISWSYNCDYTLEQSTSDIINNSNQNTQQIIESQQDINSSIINDNIDNNTTSHAGTFFNSNSYIPDHGLSNIVTLPVTLLQGILNSGNSCNDLILFDADNIFGLGSNIISLPSGCMLWSHADSNILLVYNTVLFGFFGYALLVDIWKTVNNYLDPEKKSDYIMEL